MNEPPPSPTCPECGEALPEEGQLCPSCVAATLQSEWDLIHQEPVEAHPGEETPHLPGWEVLEPLGAGGQGIVWKAERLDDSHPGALKVFRSGLLGGDESAARVQNEAAALESLDHEGIVKILERGELPDGRFYVITEFVEGCDLRRLMQAQRLPVERVLEIMRRVTEAVAHAHSRGLVHRDLKPANILVGRDDSVKLADFSLARSLSSHELLVTMTRAGTTFGTPYYLAPEVMRGSAASPAADVYALGVLLYEMLTGAPPAGRFSKVSASCDLPREVDALIEALLAERPAERPTAERVLSDLDQLQALRAGALAANLRRHRWSLVGGVAACALVAGLAGYLIPHPVPPPVPPPEKNAAGFANPAAGTRAAPWRNSLDMAFIPVPGIDRVLVCRHETKMSDFLLTLEGSGPEWEAWEEAFGMETMTRVKLSDLRPSGWEPQESSAAKVAESLKALNLPEGAAACGVNLFMARRFCAWLTWKEQREGRLAMSEFYRLPTDAEWSLAAGMPAETEPLVERRHKSMKGIAHPWGKVWPPPPGYANYAGTEARDPNWPVAWSSLPGKNDAFPRAAPVGSFQENEHGLFDLWGNVWEWCESTRNHISAETTLRGGSWVEGGFKPMLRQDYRRFERPNERESTFGFRCLLVVPDLPK